MIDYSDFFDYLRMTALTDVAGEFASRTCEVLRGLSHGDYEKWCAAISAMPEVKPSRIDLCADVVTVAGDMEETAHRQLKEKLMQLHPWRKGSFDLFGIHIDTEWRSDLKWSRLGNYINLKDKLILDVGCGNGYYLYRLLGAGAKAAVGVDPFLLYVMQFHAINKYARTDKAAVLPLGIEGVPKGCGCFDTVFSMGLLYHRREPKNHLAELFGFLKPGGQLVLETIVLDKRAEELLVPEGRYAKMHNVWNIPSPRLLEKWLAQSGFENIQVIDITKTTSNEQRKTDWMTYESLNDFLDPNDKTKTIEGYPAPVRAIL
ncbi:MAG: tRNA 5-methoxyuridine(34)/uridine 5-oxyacetic acid(34) synthase CmoB, partial [Phycisphaerae bacterium]|nr:tRNA 5-methoxyuridine(34)/uridine 5-oxyacetic acid(34) synthase CmoB [Phycisphaerae bacterium]